LREKESTYYYQHLSAAFERRNIRDPPRSKNKKEFAGTLSRISRFLPVLLAITSEKLGRKKKKDRHRIRKRVRRIFNLR
jgi:hypothetical protein